MARTLREYFPRGAGPHENPAFAGVTGSYRFDVEGQGSVRIEVANGTFTVAENPGPADCVIQMEEDDLPRIASGEQNLLTALMQGRVRVQGDFALAQKFHGLVRTRRAAA